MSICWGRRDLRAGASLLAIIAGLGLANAYGAPGDQAQATAASTTATPVETIVVTGFRSSLEKALQAKRKSDTAIDSIAAEDMAKFPDLNLSEAVQRVPGVAL